VSGYKVHLALVIDLFTHRTRDTHTWNWPSYWPAPVRPFSINRYGHWPTGEARSVERGEPAGRTTLFVHCWLSVTQRNRYGLKSLRALVSWCDFPRYRLFLGVCPFPGVNYVISGFMWSTGDKYLYHGQVVKSVAKLPQAVNRIECYSSAW